MDLADTYITFVRQNQDILRDRVNDELYIEKVFDVSADCNLESFCTFRLSARICVQTTLSGCHTQSEYSGPSSIAGDTF